MTRLITMISVLLTPVPLYQTINDLFFITLQLYIIFHYNIQVPYFTRKTSQQKRAPRKPAKKGHRTVPFSAFKICIFVSVPCGLNSRISYKYSSHEISLCFLK